MIIDMRVSEQSNCTDQGSSVRKTHCQWETEQSSVQMNKELSVSQNTESKGHEMT